MAVPIATLPAANPIALLVADSSGAGVWFLDSQGSMADALYHVSATGALTAYPVSNLGGQARDGLAVSTTGMVWFGVNNTLIELDPHTDKIRRWTIPAFRANASMQHLSVNDPAGARAVDALAAGPSGQVAIAMNNQSSVVLFDSNTATFSSLNLPQATDAALSVTYSSNGSLCIGMSNIATGGYANELLLVRPGGATAHVTVPDGTAWEVAPYDASTFVVGSFNPHMVTSSGEITKINAPAALTGTAAAPTPLWLLPNGKLLGVSDNGLIEFPSKAPSVAAATAQTSALIVSVPCATGGEGSFAGNPVLPSSSPQPTPTPYPPGSKCFDHYGDINAVDGAGNIWFVSKDTQAGVAMVKPKG